MNNCNRLYGQPNPEFTYSVEGADLIGEPVITCDATESSPVGTYDIAPHLGTIRNEEVMLVHGVLTVKGAPLTISAGSYSMEQGEAIPQFVATYEGFVLGEDEVVLTKKPVFTCAATANSEPGEYAVIVSGAEAKNYTISYVNGTLVVMQPSAVSTLSMRDDTPVSIYTSAGRLLMHTTAGRLATTQLMPGIYIIRTAGTTMKMIRK